MEVNMPWSNTTRCTQENTHAPHHKIPTLFKWILGFLGVPQSRWMSHKAFAWPPHKAWSLKGFWGLVASVQKKLSLLQCPLEAVLGKDVVSGNTDVCVSNPLVFHTACLWATSVFWQVGKSILILLQWAAEDMFLMWSCTNAVSIMISQADD